MLKRRFVVASFNRTTCDDYARAFDKFGILRSYASGTYRGSKGISGEVTKLNPAFGLLAYIAARLTTTYYGESFRYILYPLFDSWVKTLLNPEDCLMSTYGHANESFKWVKAHGGTTFIDGVMSHPDFFWPLLKEEQKVWSSTHPPLWPGYYRRSLDMLKYVDYVFAPSAFVERSFLSNGFSQDRVFKLPYPADLTLFKPRTGARQKNKPLTIINTGSLSLRKGSPYLLEAFRMIKKEVPDARLLLIRQVRDEMRGIVSKYNDLSIEWFPTLGCSELAEHLRQADIFILPSIEDGFARTVTEALACGLPVITTQNTGASDLVIPGVSGEIVPIRDAKAIAEAVFKWWPKITAASSFPIIDFDRNLVSSEVFDKSLFEILKKLNLLVK